MTREFRCSSDGQRHAVYTRCGGCGSAVGYMFEEGKCVEWHCHWCKRFIARFDGTTLSEANIPTPT